ncbi:MAG: XdhC family protein, partial [Clostridia bacterium]|nr:XdhC family protein [Clostridia bacterium]
AERFPMADELIVCDLTDIKSSITLTENDYCVIMTPDHAFDYDLQNQVLRGDFAYVGVIGNAKKAPEVQQKLREAGVSDEAISQIHTPVGLDLHCATVEEIALSIAAQLVLCRAQNREEK